MTAYTVEANTGSSIWPVTTYETTPEVEEYLRSQPAFTPHIAPGQAGMFCAPRFAEALVHLLEARPESGQEEVHAAAVRQMAHLVHLATTHHGAALQWEQTVS